MAGRVERRINDKFYFVLDEVGGSSDNESELATNAHAQPIDDLSQRGDSVKDKDVHVTKDDPDLNETEGRNSDVEMCCSSPNGNVSQNSSSDKDDERRERNGSSSSCVISKDKSHHKRKNTSRPEESTAVVDMDIDSDLDCTETVKKPLLKITFRDDAVAKLMKSSFLKFISQKFDGCTIITNSENSLELDVYDPDPRKASEEKDLLDFNLDTKPGDNHLDVPNYGKTHDLVLSDKSSKDKQDNKKLHAAPTWCFNCMGNHNLRDCPQARDFRVINKNRLKFQSQKEKSLKSSRYHLDENQKFSHLVPGMISKKLRNALNLKRDQQPSFIYRMRLLGYPPAWLEEAKVSHSGVALYDDMGVPVLEEDEEEGEILPEGSKDKFDINRIIEFPGFNVPLPSNFKDVGISYSDFDVITVSFQNPNKKMKVFTDDLVAFQESKYYQCPCYSEEQSKESLIKHLEPKTVQAYVKKSLNSQKPEAKSSPKNELKRTASSPTIEEMEEKKRQLLMELNIEDSGSDPKDSPSQKPTSSESSSSRNVGAVKNSEFGTPILKSFSPFSRLPSREQFSCNVSDVINFENLPNSTGKYESMREVISKIRTSTSKIEKD